MTWYDNAACKGDATEDYATWDPWFDADAPPAWMVELCAGCPVKAECLAAALDFERGRAARSRWGYRAGTTPEQRATLQRREQRAVRDGGRRTKLTRQERAVRLRMAAYGATDEEIAEHLNIPTEHVARWRAKGHVAAKPQERLRMWEQGATDDEIAARLGTTRCAIKSWRARRGLRRNPAFSQERRAS